jgi:hypothetical protein
MGLWVFLLICGPAAALLYFPLTTRKQSLQLVRAVVPQTSARTIPARKGSSPINWTGEATQQQHTRKSAA